MDFTEVVKNRWSCKKYADKPVEEERLREILDAGRLAPTAKNLQEQRVYVLRSPEELAKVDRLTPCRYGAPVVLAVAYDRENVYVYPGEKRDSGVEDAAIVATHMLLAAFNAGVDSCWVNRFDPDQAREALGLPENEELVMLLDLGYAAPGAGPLPNHRSRKDLAQTVNGCDFSTLPN